MKEMLMISRVIEGHKRSLLRLEIPSLSKYQNLDLELYILCPTNNINVCSVKLVLN